MDYKKLDPLIHQPARLSILAALSAGHMSFTALRDTIQISDSLLSRYISQLEKAGYVCVSKEFVDKYPKTWLCLSDKGSTAFQEHIKLLQKLAGKSKN